MDWRSLGSYLALGLVLLACSGGTNASRVKLATGATATAPSVGMSKARATSKSTLAYHVALAGPYLLSVELGTRFTLVVRHRPASSGKKSAPRRIDLATADYDILDLVADAEGGRAFVSSTAGWVRGYQLSDGTLLSEWHMGSSATALALTGDGKSLLIGTASGLICLRRLRDGAQLQCLVAHGDRVSALDSHGTTLASGSWDGGLALWSLPGLHKKGRREGEGFISDLAFSGDGTALAVARNGRRPVRAPELNKEERRSPGVDPVGRNLIEVHQDTSSLTDLPRRLEGHESVISALAWIGTDLISTSWDRTVQMWNTLAPGQVRRLLKLPHLASDVATSQRGGEVGIGGWATEDGSTSVRWGQLLYPAPRD